MVSELIRFGEKLVERFKYRHATELDIYHKKHLSEIPELKVDFGEEDVALHIKTSVLESISDTERILNEFRKGDTVLIVKIRKLRERNLNDLKKVISRLKTHCENTGSDIAGIDEDWIVLAPKKAKIVRE